MSTGRQVLWSSLISEAVAAVFLSSTTLLSQQSQSFQHAMKGYESSLAGSLGFLVYKHGAEILFF